MAEDRGGLGEGATGAPHPAVPGERRPRRRRGSPPSLFWPLVLIGFGVLLLLSNLGYIAWSSWSLLWRLWPVLLIAAGLDILFGRRSAVGAIVSALLGLLLVAGVVAILFFAQSIPSLSRLAQPAELRTEHFEHPLGDLKETSVAIDWGSPPVGVKALGASANLVEADIAHHGQAQFEMREHLNAAEVKLGSRLSVSRFWADFTRLGDWGKERWEVRLSPQVSLKLALDGGSGPAQFDLTGLKVAGLSLDAGSAAIDLALPSGGSFNGYIDAGSGTLAIVLPKEVGARVILDKGSGPFDPGERLRLVLGGRRGSGTWETEGFAAAPHQVVLTIEGGSGAISIR